MRFLGLLLFLAASAVTAPLGFTCAMAGQNSANWLFGLSVAFQLSAAWLFSARPVRPIQMIGIIFGSVAGSFLIGLALADLAPLWWARVAEIVVGKT